MEKVVQSSRLWTSSSQPNCYCTIRTYMYIRVCTLVFYLYLEAYHIHTFLIFDREKLYHLQKTPRLCNSTVGNTNQYLGAFSVPIWKYIAWKKVVAFIFLFFFSCLFECRKVIEFHSQYAFFRQKPTPCCAYAVTLEVHRNCFLHVQKKSHFDMQTWYIWNHEMSI